MDDQTFLLTSSTTGTRLAVDLTSIIGIVTNVYEKDGDVYVDVRRKPDTSPVLFDLLDQGLATITLEGSGTIDEKLNIKEYRLHSFYITQQTHIGIPHVK